MKNLDFELDSRFPPLKTPRRASHLSLETTLHTLKLPPHFCLCLHSKWLKFPLENVSHWDEADILNRQHTCFRWRDLQAACEAVRAEVKQSAEQQISIKVQKWK